MAIANGEPMVAVVRCNGTCEMRPKIAEYSGLRTCAAMNACGAGETACGFGCLGCGDCVAACQFDAIHMNPETGTLLTSLEDLAFFNEGGNRVKAVTFNAPIGNGYSCWIPAGGY